MEKGNLIPSEFESDMVNRLAALVAQKLSEPAGLSKPNYEETQLPSYSKVSPILANSTEALRIIKDAEIRERDGIKRQIVKIANTLAFTVNSNEQIGSEETVDVVLKKNNLTIACFVFNCGHLSCGPKFIEQCTNSNFDSVIVCTSGNDNFDRIGTLLGPTFRKISVVQLSLLTNYLAGLGCNTLRKEFSFKGRKVTIEYKRLSDDDAELKSNAIKRVLLKGISK